MSEEADVITKEFEKLVDKNRDQLTSDLEQKSPAATNQLTPIRCAPGEVCHGGDVIGPKRK